MELRSRPWLRWEKKYTEKKKAECVIRTRPVLCWAFARLFFDDRDLQLCRDVAVQLNRHVRLAERAQWIRTMFAEWNRILNHLMFSGSFPLELGAMTPIFYAFREREMIQDMLESVTGARMHHSYCRVGGLKDDLPPHDRVVIFDEAQRAWDREMTADFMRRKKGRPGFTQSEPEFLLSYLNRHTDWVAVICLVGGGQEINRGEAGISAWLDAVATSSSKLGGLHLTEPDGFRIRRGARTGAPARKSHGRRG